MKVRGVWVCGRCVSAMRYSTIASVVGRPYSQCRHSHFKCVKQTHSCLAPMQCFLFHLLMYYYYYLLIYCEIFYLFVSLSFFICLINHCLRLPNATTNQPQCHHQNHHLCHHYDGHTHTHTQLATFFMVAAVALALLTICFLVFLIFMKSTRVFHICGWMQIISGQYICTYVYLM